MVLNTQIYMGRCQIQTWASQDLDSKIISEFYEWIMLFSSQVWGWKNDFDNPCLNVSCKTRWFKSPASMRYWFISLSASLWKLWAVPLMQEYTAIRLWGDCKFISSQLYSVECGDIFFVSQTTRDVACQAAETLTGLSVIKGQKRWKCDLPKKLR